MAIINSLEHRGCIFSLAGLNTIASLVIFPIIFSFSIILGAFEICTWFDLVTLSRTEFHCCTLKSNTRNKPCVPICEKVKALVLFCCFSAKVLFLN